MKKLIGILALVTILCLAMVLPGLAVKIAPYSQPLHDIMHWDAKSAKLIVQNPEGEGLTVAWPATVDLWNYDGNAWTYDLPDGDHFAFNKVVHVDLTSGLVAAGAVRSMVISQTLTADCPAPAYHEVLSVTLNSQYIVGQWANAIVAKIIFDPDGDARTGMASVICAEMYLKDGATTGGSYYTHESTIIAPTGWLGALPTSQVVAFELYNIAGAGSGDLDDNAYLFHLAGAGSETGHLLYTHVVTTPGAAAGSLKINIDGTSYYLYFWGAEGTT